MAKRPIFITNEKSSNFIDVADIDFKWYPGFDISQKQKSINSLHNSFHEIFNDKKILEISSKSMNEVGIKLSAFNLYFTSKITNDKVTVESAFQSSKVFEKGGPYLDLLYKSSREAKQDLRLKESGSLICFQFEDKKWSLEPKTIFYDWLYISVLLKHKELVNEITKFDAFSDIEFNPEKSINCQARSAALFVSLYRQI